jgi:hypothetical protein
MKVVENLQKKYEKSEKNIQEFAELLDSLENLQDKKKMLWKQIYENALNDRESAGMLFADSYKGVSTAQDHIAIGPMMARYLERMSKSNEQILKLAELISKEESKANRIDPDDLFSQIDGG